MVKVTVGLFGLFCLILNAVCDQDPVQLDLSHYHNYTSLQNLFRRLVEDHPTLAKLYSIGKVHYLLDIIKNHPLGGAPKLLIH